MTLHRILSPVDGHDPRSWQLALHCAEQINQASSPAVREVVLLLHTKDLLNGYTSLCGFIGEGLAKKLKAGQQARLPSGAMLRVETKRTVSGFARPTTVIAFYADDTILEQVDGLRSVAGVVAVPEFLGQADGWKARWAPDVPGQAAAPPAPLIDDPVVVKALESLSVLVNKTKGALTAPYQDWAEDVLRILRAKGHSAEAKDVKSWAIRDGWSIGAADDLAKLAGKIFALRTAPRLGGIANAQQRYDSWRA